MWDFRCDQTAGFFCFERGANVLKSGCQNREMATEAFIPFSRHALSP